MKHITHFQFSQFLLAVLLFCNSTLSGTTVYSVQDGLWSDADTWGGEMPDLTTDSIVVGHMITLDENVTLDGIARLTILEGAEIDQIHNKSLDLEAGTVLYNAGQINIASMSNHGTIYNTGLIKLEGDLINHDGIIYNDAMIYVKNLLTQHGMLSGNGGEYMIENSLNSDPETIATCTGDPINICNPDGVTDPCHGPGQFISGCVMICGQLLDLDLIAFEAYANQDEGSVAVSWTTSHEVGLAYYVVERTAPHALNWQIVSPEIPARGNLEDGIYHYSFVDKRPLFGINIYRLLCYHLDGDIGHSFVASADVESAWMIGLAPNPFAHAIDIYGDLTLYSKLEIMGVTGQVLFVCDTPIPQSLQLSFLENGWYMVRLNGPGKERIFPILKI